MPLENWSDRIILVKLQDDPQFTDDMNALTDQLAQRDGADVLLDMSDVHFLNSSNIARLLKLRKMQSSAQSGRMKLCGIQTSVWGVFLVTGLDKIFDLADDVSIGLAMLQLDSGADAQAAPNPDACFVSQKKTPHPDRTTTLAIGAANASILRPTQAPVRRTRGREWGTSASGVSIPACREWKAAG